LDEYNNVLDTTEVTLHNIHKLTWLDACIKEQWRIYPVAPLIARQIYKPINLSKYLSIQFFEKSIYPCSQLLTKYYSFDNINALLCYIS